MSEITSTVHGVRKGFPLRTAKFEFGAIPVWSVQGPLGPRELSPRGRDLVDLAGAVYRIELQIYKRATDPAVLWELTIPVRDPDFWTRIGAPLLASCLQFMNRARWALTFVGRPDAVDFVRAEPDARWVEQITLFSGGMDSLSGAGSQEGSREIVQLVSITAKRGFRAN